MKSFIVEHAPHLVILALAAMGLAWAVTAEPRIMEDTTLVKGHTYLRLIRPGTAGTWVHDPECPKCTEAP